MPGLIKTVDEIMDEEKRDMYFIRFGTDLMGPLGRPASFLMWRHLQWFKAKCLLHAAAAPRGWLVWGDFRYRAVYFDGTDDSRVAEYSGRFEDKTGRSLDPEAYQMVLQTYQSWLVDDGPLHANSARCRRR